MRKALEENYGHGGMKANEEPGNPEQSGMDTSKPADAKPDIQRTIRPRRVKNPREGAGQRALFPFHNNSLQSRLSITPGGLHHCLTRLCRSAYYRVRVRVRVVCDCRVWGRAEPAQHFVSDNHMSTPNT